MIRQRFNDRGAVALITTIVISILLSIVIIGVMIVMISELRQSNDNEQSIRAYYAAESGVEDAIVKAIASPGVNQDCTTSSSSSTKNLNLDAANLGKVGWSCQQIHFSGQPSGSLSEADKSVQIDLEGAANFHSFTLEWDTGGPKNTLAVPSILPQTTNWNNRPAALELTVVEYPDSSIFTVGGIKIKNFLILPRYSNSPDISVDAPSGSNPWLGTCSNAGTYHCKVVIENFNLPSSSSYMLRLRTRYVGTDYKFTFYQGNNGVGLTQVVPDGTATIDVTGKAGDVYRRVVYKIPFNKGAAVGLDYVLFSDQNVCKDLTIINGAVQTGSACPYP